MKVSQHILGAYVARKEVAALALASKIKEMHTSSVVYNYTPQTLATKLTDYGYKIDYRTVEKRINILIKNEDAVISEKGHLILKNIGKNGFAIPIKGKLTLKQTEDYILGMHFKRIASHSKFNIELKSLCQKRSNEPKTLDELRKIKKLISKHKLSGRRAVIDAKVKFTIQTISEMLKCSIAKVYKVLDILKTYDGLNVINNIKYIGHSNRKLSVSLTLKGERLFVSKNGLIYSVECNNYEFNFGNRFNTIYGVKVV